MRLFYLLLLPALGATLCLGACGGKKDFYNVQTRIFFADLGNDITYDHPQVAPDLKQVIQYEGDRPMNIATYNRQGQLIFHHYKQYVHENWPGEYLTMIRAYVYEGERLRRTYELHSNVGFTIKDYTYPWWGWQSKEYVRENSYDPRMKSINGNPFREIEQILSWEQLVQHPHIQELERRGEKRLVATRTFGLDSLLDREVYHEGDETPSQTQLTYNGQQQLVQQRSTLGGRTQSVLSLRYDQSARLSQAVEVGSEGDTTQWHLYHYNEKGQLREQFILEGSTPSDAGEVVHEFLKIVYTYSPQGRVSSSSTFQTVIAKDCGFTCAAHLREQTVYQHNAQGYITQEQTIDSITGQRTVKTYRYDYRYY